MISDLYIYFIIITITYHFYFLLAQKSSPYPVLWLTDKSEELSFAVCVV